MEAAHTHRIGGRINLPINPDKETPMTVEQVGYLLLAMMKATMIIL